MTNKFLFTILACLILTFACCIFEKSHEQKYAAKLDASTACNEIKDEGGRNECNSLVSGQNETFCETDYPDYLAEQCYTDFAVARKDSSICDKAGDGRNVCYQSLALEYGLSDYCEKITDSLVKDMCYRDQATEYGKYELCDRISDSEMQAFCKALDKSGKSACDNANQSSYCILSSAIQSKNPSDCSGIDDETTKIRCLMHSSFDESACDRISASEEDSKAICLAATAEKQGNERICPKIADQTRRDECYLYVAKKKLNESICELIPKSGDGSSSKRNFCYYHVGIIRMDIDLCAKVREKSKVARQSDMCYYHAALRMAGMDRVKSYSLM